MKFLKLERPAMRGLVYQLGFTFFATWVIWPIYADPYFFVALVAAIVLGIGGAIALVRRASSWLGRILFALVTVVLLGPFVSSPSIFSSGSGFFRNWTDAVSSLVFGWKQLVTIDPPVGTYHGLMTPAFVVFFLANFAGALVVIGSAKRQWLAIVPFFAMVVFAFAFGQSTVDDKTNFFGIVLDVPSSYLSGLVILIASIKFLTPRLGKRSGLQFSSLRSVGALTRKTAQVGSSWALVIAALVIVSLVLGVNSVSSRQVLRSATPANFESSDLSPLSLYRQNFTNTEKLNNEILRFESDSTEIDRIRLAVMTSFDGQVFKVENEEGKALSFSLLPAALVAEQPNAEIISTRISLLDRESVWLPLVSNVSKVEFSGEAAQDFGDSFYFNRSTNSGALLGSNTPAGEVTYKVESFSGGEIDPSQITSTPNRVCSDALNGDGVVPQTLCDWLDLQEEDLSTAVGFENLIKNLRARGYLTHSLDQPTGQGNWTELLSGNYAFVSAKAGHSQGRIEQMFKDLTAVQKANKPGAPNSRLVATAGDDEQFATAAALLARAAGFDSRVVIGFKTVSNEPNAGVQACANSVCAGKNLTAWVEISGGDSNWLPIDVTPQFKNRPVPPTVPPGLDQNDANPVQDDATVVPPAPVAPAPDSCEEPDGCGPDERFDWLGLIGSILSVIGTAILIVSVIFGPPVAVLLGKRRRRRNRQNAATLAERITGAWDEYVDNLIDLGERGLRRLPANETRPELLVRAAIANQELANSAFARAMVRYTDSAAFAPYQPNPADEQVVWDFVDTEYSKATAALSRYRKVRVMLSLRSIIYRASAPEANTVNTRRIGAEGSTLAAFVAVARQGVSEGYDWLQPRVKKFVDSRLPFINRIIASASPVAKKVLSAIPLKRKSKKSEGTDGE